MEHSLVEEALTELQIAQANTKETGLSSPFLLMETGLKDDETLRTDTKKIVFTQGKSVFPIVFLSN